LSIHFQSEWADVKIYYILISINKKKQFFNKNKNQQRLNRAFGVNKKQEEEMIQKWGKKKYQPIISYWLKSLFFNNALMIFFFCFGGFYTENIQGES